MSAKLNWIHNPEVHYHSYSIVCFSSHKETLMHNVMWCAIIDSLKDFQSDTFDVAKNVLYFNNCRDHRSKVA